MNNEISALIMTVGGSPEPLIKSICHFKPGWVVFIASNESIEQIPLIKAQLRESACPRFKDHKILVENINDATHCYQKILEATGSLEKAGILPAQILADITGGTKVMSAALLLAAGTKGYQINYTGGAERTKDGVGTVITGSEALFKQVNPWDALVLEERRRATQFFNSFQFWAAASLFKSAAEKSGDPALKRYLLAVTKLSEAYAEWDKFHHSAAYDLLKGRQKPNEFLF